jgi:4-hydroxy-2-oxoheptanedioate aldolase
MVHGSGYQKTANSSVLVLAMIETRQAIANLDAILAVDGIDGIYVGPSDLGLSLGHDATLDPTAPEVLSAIAEIASRTKAAGRLAGIHTGSAAMITRSFAQGYDFASLLTDARIFTSAVSSQLAAVGKAQAAEVRGY